MQVEVKIDCDTSSDILSVVKEFAHSNKSSRILVLAVMSHGDTKDNIVCNKGSVCGIQFILKELNVSRDQPKV